MQRVRVRERERESEGGRLGLEEVGRRWRLGLGLASIASLSLSRLEKEALDLLTIHFLNISRANYTHLLSMLCFHYMDFLHILENYTSSLNPIFCNTLKEESVTEY